MMHDTLKIPISSKDPRYSMVWYYMRKKGKTYEEALTFVEERKKNPPLPTPNPRPCPELALSPDDAVAIWDITNDLATLNRNMKTLIGVMEKIEKHLAALAEKQENK